MFALLHNRNTSFARCLSLLLVVFILYGTTVEAAHCHGRLIPAPTSTASHVDNEQSKDLTNNKNGCNDCLICQLHQNFATTLIALRLKHEPPAQAPQRVATAVPEDLLSRIISPVAGRAPPQAN